MRTKFRGGKGSRDKGMWGNPKWGILATPPRLSILFLMLEGGCRRTAIARRDCKLRLVAALRFLRLGACPIFGLGSLTVKEGWKWGLWRL